MSGIQNLEMSQLAECLPCRHKDLSPGQHPNKVSGMVTFISSPSREGEPCHGGGLQGAHPVV